MFIHLLELMLLYVPLVIGVAMTFSVSKYPDMSVDGVFVLGAAVSSLCSRNDFPVMSSILAPLCGAAAGVLTTSIHFRFGINRVLSGVIVLLALYSINLFIIGGANFSFLTHPTIFSAFNFSSTVQRIPILLIVVLICILAISFLLNTVFGLRLRAAGDNATGFPELLRFPSLYKSGGVIIGSALVATSGALVAQSQGFADVRGFGFAVLEGQDALVDWGIRRVQSENKNAKSLKRMKELIVHYQPGVLVLEDASAKNSLRSPRIRRLCRQINKLAATHKVSVKLFSRDQVMKTFLPDGQGTKYALAEIVAERFSEELSQKLPPKRKLGNSEDSRMNIFDAVALALALRLKKAKEFHEKE